MMSHLKFLSIILFSLLTACGQSGFSKEDIDNMKKSIKSEFEGRGADIKVTEIELITESPKKVTGFVKIKVGDDDPIMKDCSATMGDDNRYIWKCE